MILWRDHITPKKEGGKESYENYQLLHRHCHDSKTAVDRKRERDKIREANDQIAMIWNKGVNGEAMTEEESRAFYAMTR